MLFQTGQNVGCDCSCCSRDLLHRPPRGGNIHKNKLAQRFDDFAAGKWMQLLHASRKCDEEASVAMHRKRRRDTQSIEMERRAARALSLVQMGELSSGRQALEGASLAPCSEETLNSLRFPLSVHQCRCGRFLDSFWPSSSCVRESGGSGKTGIRHRERCYKRVSGRRRQGCNQRVVERFRAGRASCQGWTPIGDHRRWPPLVRWRAACC